MDHAPNAAFCLHGWYVEGLLEEAEAFSREMPMEGFGGVMDILLLAKWMEMFSCSKDLEVLFTHQSEQKLALV